MPAFGDAYLTNLQMQSGVFDEPEDPPNDHEPDDESDGEEQPICNTKGTTE
jgi:hypothetical protein